MQHTDESSVCSGASQIRDTRGSHPTDHRQRGDEGGQPLPTPRRARTGGHEPAGIVVEVGSLVKGVEADDVIKTNRAKVILVGWHQAPATYELFNRIKCPIVYNPQGIGMSTLQAG